MYSEEVRQRALDLLREGHSAYKVSQLMGGRPGHAIIRLWAAGETPKGKRAPQKMFSQAQKLAALQRMDNGESYRTVASDLGCPPTTVLTWRRIRNEQGPDGLRTKLDDWI